MIYYIDQKIFSFMDKYSIVNEKKEECYFVRKEFMIPCRFILEDTKGNSLEIVKNSFVFYSFDIIKNGIKIAEIIKNFSLFFKSFDIESNKGNYKLEGDIFAWSFDIYNNEKIIASISKEIFPFADSYKIEILNDDDTEISLATVIVIDYCFHNGR